MARGNNIDTWVGISAGLKPIPGVDTPSLEQVQPRARVTLDRRALYARAETMAPTHALVEAGGLYHGVILRAKDEQTYFVGFRVDGKWAVPLDSWRTRDAVPLCEVRFAPSRAAGFAAANGFSLSQVSEFPAHAHVGASNV